MHQPQLQWSVGDGSVLRCFRLDCSLCTSVMMSSTGRPAGQEDGADCANTAAHKTTTDAASLTCT